jgi:hypothetical protein
MATKLTAPNTRSLKTPTVAQNSHPTFVAWKKKTPPRNKNKNLHCLHPALFFHSTELRAQEFTGEKPKSFQGQELPFKLIPEECCRESITKMEVQPGT